MAEVAGPEHTGAQHPLFGRDVRIVPSDDDGWPRHTSAGLRVCASGCTNRDDGAEVSAPDGSGMHDYQDY